MNCHFKKSLLVAILCLSVAVLAVEKEFTPTEDYCNASLCHGKKHVACGVNSTNIDFIINRFNEIRSKIAEGIEGWPPAARMASMLWDEELAYFARINVRECIQHRDLCRNTAKYKHVGQTVVYRAVNSLNRPDGLKNIIFRMMSKWSKWSKSIGGVMMNIRNYTYDHYAPKETYSQLILENANKVGCAALQMLQNGWRQYFFTCNYAQSPIVGKPIYSGIFGRKPGESCKTGRHKKWKNLCGSDEFEKDAKSSNETEISAATMEEERGGAPVPSIDSELDDSDMNNGTENALDKDVDPKIYRLKFSRFIRTIKNATRFAKKRNIVIVTSNHQVDVDAPIKQDSEEQLIGPRTKHAKKSLDNPKSIRARTRVILSRY
ncbi:hypothetical protein ACLKA6_014452 [Drosophila palustris]